MNAEHSKWIAKARKNLSRSLQSKNDAEIIGHVESAIADLELSLRLIRQGEQDAAQRQRTMDKLTGLSPSAIVGATAKASTGL